MGAEQVKATMNVAKVITGAAEQPQTQKTAEAKTANNSGSIAAMFGDTPAQVASAPVGVAANTDAAGLGEVISAAYHKFVSFFKGKAFFYDYKITQYKKEHAAIDSQLDEFFGDQKVAEDKLARQVAKMETIMAEGKRLKEKAAANPEDARLQQRLVNKKREAANQKLAIQGAKEEVDECIVAYKDAERALHAVQLKIEVIVADLVKAKRQLKTGARYEKTAAVLRDAESFAGDTKKLIDDAREAEIRGKAALERASEKSGVLDDYDDHQDKIDDIAKDIEF